jgi:hypothetical protein
VLELRKSTLPAIAAVPLLVIVAWSAVLVPRKVMLFCRFVIFALPALLASRKPELWAKVGDGVKG